MKWINEHKHIFRITFLVFLVIAISGPWFFDRIHVPSPYTCSAPNVRLDDEFCGLPLSVTWFFSAIAGALPDLVTAVATGAFDFGGAARQSIFFLLLSLLLLPVFSSAILILFGERRHWPTIHTVGLGLAAGIGGCIAWLSYSTASWTLWGLWLYIGLTVTMCILEVMMRRIPSNAMRSLVSD